MKTDPGSASKKKEVPKKGLPKKASFWGEKNKAKAKKTNKL